MEGCEMFKKVVIGVALVGLLAGSSLGFERRVLFEEFTAEW
jgi:hypothetical protein